MFLISGIFLIIRHKNLYFSFPVIFILLSIKIRFAIFFPEGIPLKELPILLRLCSVCLRVMALTAQAYEVIKRAFPALAAKYNVVYIAAVTPTEHATIPVSLNRLPLRSSEQFAILLSVLVHVVNALSMLQPLLSL